VSLTFCELSKSFDFSGWGSVLVISGWLYSEIFCVQPISWTGSTGSTGSASFFLFFFFFFFLSFYTSDFSSSGWTSFNSTSGVVYCTGSGSASLVFTKGTSLTISGPETMAGSTSCSFELSITFYRYSFKSVLSPDSVISLFTALASLASFAFYIFKRYSTYCSTVKFLGILMNSSCCLVNGSVHYFKFRLSATYFYKFLFTLNGLSSQATGLTL